MLASSIWVRPFTGLRWAALATGLATLVAACAVLACIPTVASADTIVTEGAITSGDPNQTGRILRDDPATTCGASTSASFGDTKPNNYDPYSCTNHSSAAQCITGELDPKTSLSVPNRLQSVAYSSY